MVMVATCLQVAAFAQSSALSPFEGATHTYVWNGVAEGTSYEFYVTADAAGTSILDDALMGEFDFVGNPNGVVAEGMSAASLGIQWNLGAASNQYFLWLKVTGTNGCSNYRYVGLQPQINTFDILAENIPVDNTISCPDLSSDNGFDAVASSYDAGSTILSFKVTRVNGTNNPLTPETGDTYDWSFVPFLTVDPDWNTEIEIVSIEGANSGVITPDSGDQYTVSGFDDEVIVKVSIKNLPGTSQEVTLGVRDQVESRTNLKDSDATNDRVKHIIEVMPVIQFAQSI